MNTRIYKYDNLKAVLIILVVAAHLAVPFTSGKPAYNTFKSLFVFISSFHMPLFLMISGLFYKRTHVLKRTLFYLMTGLSLKVLMFLVALMLEGGSVFRLFTTDGIPWFMFVLAAYTVITYFLREIDWKLCLAFAFLLGCFSGYDRDIGDFLCLSRMIVYYPFFYTGVVLSKKRDRFSRAPVPAKAAGAAFVIVWGLLCWKWLHPVYRLRKFFTGRNPFPDNELFYQGALLRVLCYVITFLICFALIVLMPDRRIPVLSMWGRRTVQVYFWSQPVNNILFGRKGIFYDRVLILLRTPPGKLAFILTSLLIVGVLVLPVFRYPMHTIRKRLDY